MARHPAAGDHGAGAGRHRGVIPPVAQVRRILARVLVESIDDALPLYERLTETTAHRFSFGEVQLAWAGSFLLLAGPPEALARYRDRVASVIVGDIDEVARVISEAGGELLEGPAPAPNGPRLIARHPDGSVFEYLQIDDPLG